MLAINAVLFTTCHRWDIDPGVKGADLLEG
jgi:hypothetical protein